MKPNKITSISNVAARAKDINAKIQQVRAGQRNPITAQHGDDDRE